MSSHTQFENGIGWLYDQVTGDEDARICKDIPEEACVEQPRNFFAYLLANLLNKVSDELVSARITLPWLFNVLGVPVSFTSFLVPLREAFVLLPQLFVAAYVRSLSVRKGVWILGAALSAILLFVMAGVSSIARGVQAGWLLLLCIIFYSLARGLCSVSAKDVVGKTVSKTRRGRLMGYSTSAAGVATLLIGIILQTDLIDYKDLDVLLVFIITAGLLWLLALMSFVFIVEPAGSTEGGGNAIVEAFKSLRIVVDDKLFRKYLISRIMLLSVAIVTPFYVILFQQNFQGRLGTLGILIILSGLASSLSAPMIGKYADKNSRNVMIFAAALAGLAGVLTWGWSQFFVDMHYGEFAVYLFFFMITLAHSAVRLGRKVYLVDMANTDNRAKYVAVSNSVIGIAIVFAGLIGVLADIFNVQSVILILSFMMLASCLYIMKIPNVSG